MELSYPKVYKNDKVKYQKYGLHPFQGFLKILDHIQKRLDFLQVYGSRLLFLPDGLHQGLLILFQNPLAPSKFRAGLSPGPKPCNGFGLG